MSRKKMRRAFPTPFLRALIFVSGSLVLLGSLAIDFFPAPARAQFGVDALVALAASTRAEIVRLSPSPELTQELGATEPRLLLPSVRSNTGPRPGRRPSRRRKRTLEAWMSAPPRPVDAAWQRKVQQLLTRRGSFRADGIPSCVPLPGVAIRFNGGQSPVDVLVCFRCKMISIAPPGRPRWGYGAPCIPELLALVRQQFPYDPELAELGR